MRRVTPEGSLLKTVTDLLTAEHIWWMRCQSGAQVLTDANGKRRMFRAGRPGMADLLVLPVRWQSPSFQCTHCGTAYERFPMGCTCGGKAQVKTSTPTWLELKSPTGRQSPAQKDFQAEVEREGHRYVVIRDCQQIIDLVRGGG